MVSTYFYKKINIIFFYNNIINEYEYKFNEYVLLYKYSYSYM